MIFIDPGPGVTIEEQKLAAELRTNLDISRYTTPDTACITFTIMADKEVKSASKPADPALANALRPRPFRIGLRYLGD